MPEFDPYEYLLKNFSRHKFKTFIDRFMLDPKTYSKTIPAPYLQGIEVNKEYWENLDSAYLDVPNEGGMFGSTSYTRWIFSLDHIEEGLILPEMVWERARQGIRKLVNSLATESVFLRDLKKKLYDKYDQPFYDAVHKVMVHSPQYGKATFYYLTNALFDPSIYDEFDEFAETISLEIRSAFTESYGSFGENIDKADFGFGIGTPKTFLENNRNLSLKVIQEIETRPDSVQIQFAEGKIEVVSSNKRKLFAYDNKQPRLIALEQIVNSDSFFREEEIKEFEDLLNKPGLREEEIQRFLTDRPKFLYSLDYDELRPQISLIDDSGSELIPDFFLKPVGKEYWDILDIKLPDVQVISGSDNRKSLSSYVHRGNAQLMNYSKFFDDARNKEKLFKLTGIKCFKPRLTLVIGKKKNIDEESWNQIISQERPFVNIIGFDELIERAKKNIINFRRI